MLRREVATAEQVVLLQHSLGIGPHQRQPCRNHFIAGAGHADLPNLADLERIGYVVRKRAPSFLARGDVLFTVTDAGRRVATNALPIPSTSRYDQYLEADCSASFAQFLLGHAVPRFEVRHGYPTWYRMLREQRFDGVLRIDVRGEWCRTKKQAKASYKQALRASREQGRHSGLAGRSNMQTRDGNPAAA